MAKATFAQRRLARKARSAKIARYKSETKAGKLKAKAAYRNEVEKAKAIMPLEKARMKTSLAKHATWASTAASIFGKGTNVANNAITGSKVSSSSQNVNGGLIGTQSGRDDDEEKDTVEGGGVVY